MRTRKKTQAPGPASAAAGRASRQQAGERLKVFAVDLASGEAGLEVLARGCVKALKRFHDLNLILTGDEARIRAAFKKTPKLLRRITVKHTTDTIAMNANAAMESRSASSASVVLAAESVAAGEAFGFFSAGNTGATISSATLRLGLLPGVLRAALATVLPSSKGHMLLVDSGAGIDLSPERYLCMARLAEAYMKVIFGKEKSRVCLLNIGEEPNKGTRVLRRAYALLAERLPSFAGNIEPSDIFSGEADIILCDGFVGNIFIKLSEGIGKHMQRLLRKPLRRRLFPRAKPSQGLASGSALAEHAARRSILRNLHKFTDSERYGGSPLLGLRGIVLVGHGQARDKAVYYAIVNALLLHDAGLVAEMGAFFSGDARE
jgi:glycerol-3-phosphate acyltransferase PlsX